MSPELQRIQTVFGVIIIAAVIAGGVVAYIYLGWFGVAGVAILVVYIALQGIGPGIPVW
ncbi:MAG: hypothetical protein QOF78_4026, partial [Phycisphaerales bacterium]|nr:hypothetical protein [Phycisphaerales bacterium]